LTFSQKEKIFDHLNWNELPENRRYIYDITSSNCATKLRDVIVKSLGNEILLDSLSKDSYRSLLTPYLSERPWIKLLSDFALGPLADKKLTSTERMFLPFTLREELESAQIIHKKNPVNLIQESHHFKEKESPNISSIAKPQSLLIPFGLALVMLSIWDFQRRKILFWCDQIILLITGFTSALLMALWLGFGHKLMAWNLNLLWLLPTNLIVIFLPVHSVFRARSNMANSILIVCLLISWPILPQVLSPIFIPIMIGLLSRHVVFFILNQSANNSI
jgi:hypothetical protein